MIKNMLCVGLVLLGGCSGTKFLGEVENTRFYSVHASQFDGPNVTALVAAKGSGSKTEVSVVQTFGGSGIGTSLLPAVVSAGGQVGAASTFGTSLDFKADNTNVNVKSNGGNANGASSSANQSAIDGNQSGNISQK